MANYITIYLHMPVSEGSELDEIRAELLPENRVETIEALVTNMEQQWSATVSTDRPPWLCLAVVLRWGQPVLMLRLKLVTWLSWPMISSSCRIQRIDILEDRIAEVRKDL